MLITTYSVSHFLKVKSIIKNQFLDLSLVYARDDEYIPSILRYKGDLCDNRKGKKDKLKQDKYQKHRKESHKKNF